MRCCVCEALPVSHFFNPFFSSFMPFCMFFFKTTHFPFVTCIQALEPLRPSAAAVQGKQCFQVSCLSASTRRLWRRKRVILIYSSHRCVQRNQSVGPAANLTGEVILDQIQSDGGFPGQQKMMYSLPGVRKHSPAQPSSAGWCWNSSRGNDFLCSAFVTLLCWRGSYCHRCDLLYCFHSEQHSFSYCIESYDTKR